MPPWNFEDASAAADVKSMHKLLTGQAEKTKDPALESLAKA